MSAGLRPGTLCRVLAIGARAYWDPGGSWTVDRSWGLCGSETLLVITVERRLHRDEEWHEALVVHAGRLGWIDAEVLSPVGDRS